jgi:hypothetical protein
MVFFIDKRSRLIQTIRMLLPAVALWLTAGKTMAQSYVIVPNDTIAISHGTFEDLETLTISQQNAGIDTLWLTWRKVSAMVPDLWEATICDNTNCNTNLTDSGSMNPVLPGESGFLLLHLTPYQNYGTAVIRYVVWDIRIPSVKDTLTFILEAHNATGIRQQGKNSKIQIAPNPAMETISVFTSQQSGFGYFLQDMNGVEVLKGLSESPNQIVSVGNLPSGVYTLFVVGNDFTSTHKIIIQH